MTTEPQHPKKKTDELEKAVIADESASSESTKPDKSRSTVDDADQDANQTALLSDRNRFRRSQMGGPPNGTSTLGEQRELILIIRGMVERLVLTDNVPIVLGRADHGARFRPDVDLTPYGALDRGVSREHARLHMDGNHLFITDLGSTNGTFVSTTRLEPDEPTILRKGEELLLGRLAMQVLFR